MDLSKSIITGMIGAYCMAGIDVDHIDFDNQILYLSIPKESYEYSLGTKIINADSYAKRIKETWIEIGLFKNCRVMYKEKDVFWTKEMGEYNFEKHREEISNCSLW